MRRPHYEPVPATKVPKLERGIPIPDVTSRLRGTGIKGVVQKMKVGDSFEDMAGRQGTIRAYAREFGFRVSARVNPTDTKRMRYWRVK